MKNKINFKILFRRVKNLLKNIGSDADKDWVIILSFFFIMFFVSIAFHINLFLNIKNGLNEKDGSVLTQKQAVDSGVLDEIIGKYDKRADEYKKIEENPLLLVDPS